jgi:hypothetical protein
MKDKFKRHAKGLITFDDIADAVIKVLNEEKLKHPDHIVNFVSGSVTSDGPEYIQRNLKKLIKHTENVAKKTKAPTFSANYVVDLFSQVIPQSDNVKPNRLKFWDNIMKSQLITDVYMAPGWEKSIGATEEHKLAKKLKMEMHYL